MNALRLGGPPPDLIRDAIDAHGAARVLLRAAAALLRPRARPPDRRAPRSVLPLNAHLRRDIGLPSDHAPHAPDLLPPRF